MNTQVEIVVVITLILTTICFCISDCVSSTMLKHDLPRPMTMPPLEIK